MIDGLPGLLFLLAFLAILAGCAVTVRHDDKRTPENTYYHAGRRHCRACRTAFDHKRRLREGIA